MIVQAQPAPQPPLRPPHPRIPEPPRRVQVSLQIDGRHVAVDEGSTILDACRSLGIDTPTLCWAPNLTPVNVCRVCVVEVEGSRALVPSCSRPVSDGMVVFTDSERVRLSRRMVLELLMSSVDVSRAPDLLAYAERYHARSDAFGARTPYGEPGSRDLARPGQSRSVPAGAAAAIVGPVKVDNELYVRDYERCILCYRCVEACGEDAQNTFAIAVAGRGFDARISTELAVSLPESACVYCGNCVAVCPTGALMAASEYSMREAGTWDESRQSATETICTYCGVGCPLVLHVQDSRIVKATSPVDSPVTHGNLCIKGRFGFEFVQALPGGR